MYSLVSILSGIYQFLAIHYSYQRTTIFYLNKFSKLQLEIIIGYFQPYGFLIIQPFFWIFGLTVSLFGQAGFGLPTLPCFLLIKTKPFLPIETKTDPIGFFVKSANLSYVLKVYIFCLCNRLLMVVYNCISLLHWLQLRLQSYIFHSMSILARR